MSLDDLNLFISDRNEREKFITKRLLDSLLSKQEKVINKNKLINDLSYEKDLIIKDIIESIKTQLSLSTASLLYGANPIIYHDAWMYFHNVDKIKEENREHYKQAFTQVVDMITRKILINDKQFKLCDILFVGYDEEAYEFKYNYGLQSFSIKVPIFEHANEQNYISMLNGCIIYYHKTESTYTQILHNIDINQLALDFKEWLQNNKKEEK